MSQRDDCKLSANITAAEMDRNVKWTERERGEKSQ